MRHAAGRQEAGGRDGSEGASKLCRARNLVRAEVLVQLAAIQILCLRLCGSAAKSRPASSFSKQLVRRLFILNSAERAWKRAACFHLASSELLREGGPGAELDHRASGPPRRAPLPPGTGRDAEARKHGAAARQRFRCRALDILASSFSQRSSCSACRAALSATRLFKAQRPFPAFR